MQNIKIIASILAACVALVAWIPYLADIIKGKIQPHLYTWISFFLITIVVVYMQLIGGAGIGVMPTAIGAIVNGVILFYCFKHSTKDIVLTDKICLGLSVLGVVAYVVINDSPIVSLLTVTVAEVVSFVPTFRKTKKAPYSESLASYYLILLKTVLILIALEKYNILTVSYLALWLVVFLVFLACVSYWRAKEKHQVNSVKS